MTILKSTLIGLATASMMATGALAQADVIDGNDVNTITGIIRGYGSAESDAQTNGDPLVYGTFDGMRYAMLFRNCTDNANCEDVQFYYVVVGARPSLEAINTWNSQYRFSRAYLDVDTDPVVEMDINLEHGVTYENFAATLEVWNYVLGTFKSYAETGGAQ